MDKLFICFENSIGIKMFRPLEDIWKVEKRDDGNYRVTFHKAAGDFNEEELSAEEMANVKSYAELFKGKEG